MGILSKIIGLAFAGLGAAALLYGMNIVGVLSYVLFFVGILMMSIGFSLITAGRNTEEEKPPPPTVTEVICQSDNCEFKELRAFQKGDYILKTLDAKCPKCNATMVIEGIYVVRDEPEEDEKF